MFKKIIPYILIFSVLAGLFGAVPQAQAQTVSCYNENLTANPPTATADTNATTQAACQAKNEKWETASQAAQDITGAGVPQACYNVDSTTNPPTVTPDTSKTSSGTCVSPEVWETASQAATTAAGTGQQACYKVDSTTNPPTVTPDTSKTSSGTCVSPEVWETASQAATTAAGTAQQFCYNVSSPANPTKDPNVVSQAACQSPEVWETTDQAAQAAATASSTTNPNDKTPFQQEIEKQECGMWPSNGTIYPGCVLQISYGLFYQIPAWVLTQVAYFFNVLISISLKADLFRSSFVATGWGIVRDLSNIFFILILLYIAIKIILDIGGHDGKKMIAKVIIMALLINFSMFFTQVIIDSSNILALIFYNKLQVNPATGARPYDSVTGEPDVAGGMVGAFDPTATLSDTFFAQAKKVYVNGKEQPSLEQGNVAAGTLIALILMAGLMMCFAIYALFISGLSFVGRLIELWILIIFSPFAFMSFTIPLFEKLEDIGWDAWLKRVLKTAFMAPIFMFFLYFIFLLISSNVFSTIVTAPSPGSSDPAGVVRMLLGVVLPTLLILILLLKATKYAKKGGGVVGEKLAEFGQKVGGLAVGAITGGASLAAGVAVGGAAAGAAKLGRNTVGRVGSALGDAAWTKQFGALGRGAQNVGKFVGARSFDVRKAPGAENLAKKAGINLGAAKAIGLGPKEGGFTQARKDKAEKRKKRANELEVGENEELKQNLNKTEMDLQNLEHQVAAEVATLNREIEDKRQTLRDATAQYGAGKPEALKAGRDLDNSINKKKALREGSQYAGDKDINTGLATTNNAKDYRNVNAGFDVDAHGNTRLRTIKYMTNEEVPERKHAVETETRKRKRSYAEERTRPRGRLWRAARFVATAGSYDAKAERQAAHDIIMETKLDSKKEEKH